MLIEAKICNSQGRAEEKVPAFPLYSEAGSVQCLTKLYSIKSPECEMAVVFVDMDCEYHLCYAGLLAWFLSYKHNDSENNNLYEATPVAHYYHI